MATYNNLPAVVTENIFTYLRHERRQPPHAYCIDRLIDFTADCIDPHGWVMTLTDDGVVLYESQEHSDACEMLGNHVGDAVLNMFFVPYIVARGFSIHTWEFDDDDYEERQTLSWTFHNGDMTKKYDKYDKNGTMNFWSKDGPKNFSRL